jgi:hypothetical protein
MFAIKQRYDTDTAALPLAIDAESPAEHSASGGSLKPSSRNHKTHNETCSPHGAREAKENPMDLSLMLVGGMVLLLALCCAYKVGESQGWRNARRQDAQYGKEGLNLREGETLLGVVDAQHGSYFFIASCGKESK